MSHNTQDWILRNLSQYLVKLSGSEYSMHCPLPEHTDKDESASISIQTGKWMCHGCKESGNTYTLAKTLGLPLPPDERRRQEGNTTRTKGKQGYIGELTKTYEYLEPPNDRHVMEVMRFEDAQAGTKTFRQRYKTQNGTWIKKRPPDADWAVYRWPELAKHAPDRWAVLVVEGEKDVDTLHAIDVLATCNAGGGEKWMPGHSKTIAKTNPKAVVLVPDADEPGMRHAWKTAGSLIEAGIGKVGIAILPYPVTEKNGKDITDYLADSDGKEAKREAVRELIKGAVSANVWRKDHPEYNKKADKKPPPAAGVPPDAAKGAVETQVDLARLFFERKHSDFRLVTSGQTKFWIHYEDANGWQVVCDDSKVLTAMSYLALETWCKEDKQGTLMLDPVRGGSYTTARGALQIAASLFEEPRSLWDANPALMGLPDNEVIDLETSKIRKATRDDRITMRAAIRPAETYQKDSAFGRFILEKLPDQDIRNYVQLAGGYTMTGYTHEDLLMLLYGPTSTGKSTFVETFRILMGEYATTIPSEIVAPANSRGYINDNLINSTMAKCRGKRLVIMNEINPRGKFDTSRVASITGGDAIQVREMRENPLDTTPTYKLWMAGNHRPQMIGRNDALFRRLKEVDFIVQHLGDKIDNKVRTDMQKPENMVQAMAFFVEGARLYHQRNKQMPEPTARMKKLAREYQDDSDLVGQWIADRCEKTEHHISTRAVILYDDFERWRKDQGLTGPFSERALNAALCEEHQCKKVREGGGRVIGGLVLKGTAGNLSVVSDPDDPFGGRRITPHWQDG